MQQNDVNNLPEQEQDETTPVPDIDTMSDEGDEKDNETEKLQQEVAELKDKYLRLVAEFDNFRKRNAKERIELIQTAGKDVIVSLLDVLDDAERAEKQLDNSPAKEGVSLIFNKLRNVLASKGLKPMETLNQEFNPDLHEAITEVP